MKFEIIIPTYNDFESVKVLLGEIEKCSSTEVEFLIINNGSTDSRVWEILKNNGFNWRAVSIPKNLGFGGGVKAGLRSSKSEYVGWMPGNLKISPRAVCELLQDIELNPDIFLKALRSGRQMEFRLKTLLSGVVQSLFMRKFMRDTGGTPTLIHRNFIDLICLGPNTFVFESWCLWLAKYCKKEILRPKIFYGNRIFGRSHWQNGFSAEASLMIQILKESRKWASLVSKNGFL